MRMCVFLGILLSISLCSLALLLEIYQFSFFVDSDLQIRVRPERNIGEAFSLKRRTGAFGRSLRIGNLGNVKFQEPAWVS